MLSTSVLAVCRMSRLTITMHWTCLSTLISRPQSGAILTSWFIACSQLHSVSLSLLTYFLPCCCPRVVFGTLFLCVFFVCLYRAFICACLACILMKLLLSLLSLHHARVHHLVDCWGLLTQPKLQNFYLPVPIEPKPADNCIEDDDEALWVAFNRAQTIYTITLYHIALLHYSLLAQELINLFSPCT